MRIFRPAVCGVVLLLLATAAPADTLRLKESAYVKGPKVTLSEVADIEGPYAATLSSLEISTAPSPGTSRPVYAALISSRIKEAGIDPASFSIKGSSKTQVTTMHMEITGDMLVDSLHSHILHEMPWNPEDVEIEIPTPQRPVMVRDGMVEISWKRSPSYAFNGVGSFKGTIKVDGAVARTVLCRATLETYVTMLIAARDISRGMPVSAHAVELRKMPLSAAPNGVITDLDLAMEMVAKRSIFAGQVLSNNNLEAPVVVKRNSLIAVALQVGRLEIQDRAKALRDGRVGDTIQLENPRSGERYAGVVQRDGTVIIP